MLTNGARPGRVLAVACTLLLLLCRAGAAELAAPALPPELDGLSPERQAELLVRHVENLYRANSSRARMSMLIVTPRYERLLTMESASFGRERMLVRILEPRKDRGIATLRVEKDIWNYFPKIDKLIKVPPSMMPGSWMGSDFTHDDLVRETELAEAYHLALATSERHYTLTLTPETDTVTLWARMEILLDRTTLLPERQLFYDDDGRVAKRLTFSEPRSFSGVLLPSRLNMQSLHKPGHGTLLSYDALELNVPEITAEHFSFRTLKQRLN